MSCVVNEQLSRRVGLPPLDPADNRVMLCEQSRAAARLRSWLGTRGLREAGHDEPGHFAIEKAFVET